MPKTDTILSTKSLHYFLQLIDTMNYTQAAQILGITQPALTQQIKKIEHAIGTPLFGQMGKKLYLTEAGKQLQTGAIKLLGTINSVVSDIQEFTQADKGNIAIGVLESINYELLRKFLVEFNKNYPNITINVSYFNRKDLWYNLDNNLIDLAMLYLPETTKKSQSNIQSQYELMKVTQDRLTILTHDKNLEAGSSYPVSKFLGKKWVLYPDNFYLTQILKGKLGNKMNARNGLTVPLTFTSTKEMVDKEQDKGYDTIVSKSYYSLNKSQINLVPVFLKGIKKLNISLIYRKGKREVPRIQNFLKEFKIFFEA